MGSSKEARVRLRDEFTAIIERDGDWYVGYCAEIPGANGQGRTKEEARASLAEAIALILEDRREDAWRGVLEPEACSLQPVVHPHRFVSHFQSFPPELLRMFTPGG